MCKLKNNDVSDQNNQTIKLQRTPRGGLLSTKPQATCDALNMQLITNM